MQINGREGAKLKARAMTRKGILRVKHRKNRKNSRTDARGFEGMQRKAQRRKKRVVGRKEGTEEKISDSSVSRCLKE